MQTGARCKPLTPRLCLLPLRRAASFRTRAALASLAHGEGSSSSCTQPWRPRRKQARARMALVLRLALIPPRVESRAPQDPAASGRPCLLCTSCSCCFSDCAGRCSLLRTPCRGSFSDCAGRYSPLLSLWTCSFSDCAGRCSPLHTPCPLSASFSPLLIRRPTAAWATPPSCACTGVVLTGTSTRRRREAPTEMRSRDGGPVP